jgi:hypothetical protein
VGVYQRGQALEIAEGNGKSSFRRCRSRRKPALQCRAEAGRRLAGPFSSNYEETGRWLLANGEAIYGSTEGILDVRTLGRTTIKKNSLFLHVLCWPGREAIFYGLKTRVRSARILGTGQTVKVRQEGLHVRLMDLPAQPPDPACSVIRLALDGPPKEEPSIVHLWEQGRPLDSLSRWAGA